MFACACLCGISQALRSLGHYLSRTVFVIENRDDGKVVMHCGRDPYAPVECVLWYLLVLTFACSPGLQIQIARLQNTLYLCPLHCGGSG